jgi:hypothetical protein
MGRQKYLFCLVKCAVVMIGWRKIHILFYSIFLLLWLVEGKYIFYSILYSSYLACEKNIIFTVYNDRDRETNVTNFKKFFCHENHLALQQFENFLLATGNFVLLLFMLRTLGTSWNNGTFFLGGIKRLTQSRRRFSWRHRR